MNEAVLGHADDSVHVMIVHDQKKMQKAGSNGDVYYKPRQEHPLLAEKNNDHTVPVEMESDSKEEVDELLYHAEHHNDTVDPRDKVLAASA